MLRIAVIILLLPFISFSQEHNPDSVINLTEVQVTSSRLDKLTTGLNIIRFDTLSLEINRGNSLSALISSATPVFIKSYGPGNLSTISLQGTSPAHTGLYWNGIRLNPPNIDMEDLSLYPASFFNSIEIVEGGAASVFGNGNVGGLIHLQNKPAFNEAIELAAGGSAGSFNDYRSDANIVISNDKLWSDTRFAYKNALNDFKFTNGDGEIVKRTNAAQHQTGLLQDIFVKLKNDNILNASLWYQSADREVPGSIQVMQSDAYQKDRSVRGMIGWRKIIKNGTYSAKFAYLNSELYYFDPDSIPALQIENRITTNSAVGEVNAERRFFDRLFVATGINYRYDQCSTVAYENTPDRKTTSLFVSADYKIPAIEWNATVNLRQEFVAGYEVPFSPSFGTEGKIFRFVYGKAGISRNFRIPTFNDLYWYPFGNIALKPEKSWNAEASLVFKDKIKPEYELRITGYNSVIDDYILWIPAAGNLWSPENIQTVRARGFEISGLAKMKLNKLALNLRAGYSYTKSTNQKQTGPNDNSKGKQLIYVPLNNFTANLTFLYGGFILNYGHSYTGLRYTTRDNANYLPAYNTADITISKKLTFQKFGIKLRFDILNLYNAEYQPVAYYPMPGRNYRLSLFFRFEKK